MSLQDVMSGAGNTIFAEIALVLFFLIFVAVVVYLFVLRSRRSWERASRLPLDHGGNGGSTEEKR
jgi:cbb3-type cytochrome oxidase subunit 3